MSDRSKIIQRQAARVVLLDSQDRVLLLRCQEPGADRAFWITPGGGLEGGETHEKAAVRELREETGMVDAELGPCIWTREHTFPWLNRTYCQRERFFLVRCDGHEVCADQRTEEERIVLTEHRWWSPPELAAAKDEHFAPRSIADLLMRLIREPLPDQPIDVGA
ncbi:MAG: NUDIX domain-containing protein [Planctomycetota bacterium]